MNFKMIKVAFVIFLLQGCAGSRASYESLIETRGDEPAIYLSVGQTKEVLSIRNGFPGWWGIYPAIASFSPEIASVDCQEVIGGEVCYLTANEVGEAWLQYGNKFNMDMREPESQHHKIRVVVSSK